MYSKRFKKLVAIIMIVTMVMANVNLDLNVLFENNKKENVEVQAKETKEKEPTVVKELEHLRTADSSTYLLSNGSKRLELYGEDIRYEKNGKFIDYDPTLKKISNSKQLELEKILKEDDVTSNYEYTNTSSDVNLYFPKEINMDTGIVLEKNNKKISFKPIFEEVSNSETKEIKTATTKLETLKESTFEIKENSVKNNLISYVDEVNDIEYKYTSLPAGLKEEIILNERPDTNVFSFDINLDGMKLEMLDGSNEIRILDKKSNKIVAYISAPNIKHAEGEVTYTEVYYEINENEDGSYKLDLIVDEEYLSDKSTKYPVIIDPTIAWTSTYLESATVSTLSGTSNINMKNTSTIQIENKCNGGGLSADYEKFCYIDTSDITEGEAFYGNTIGLDEAFIENAKLRLVEYETNGRYIYNPSTSSTTFYEYDPGTVEIRNPTDLWDPDTINYTNSPGIGNTVWAEFQCTGTRMTEHYVDITNWAKAVINGEIDNYGLVLKAKEVGTGDTFYSSQLNMAYDNNGTFIGTHMAISIDYHDNSRYYGISGVYSPTGNYSETTTDMTVETALGDISLSRTYNSLRANKSSAYGKGFSFSYEMKVKATSKGAGVTMPNGSIWRFDLIGTEYVAQGNKATLTNNNGVFKLVTLDKTEYGFDENNYLSYVKDKLGNQINITVNTAGNITSITDITGTQVEFTIVEGLLTQLKEVKNNEVLQSVLYTYNDDNNLTKIAYPDGTERHYTYQNGVMTNVKVSGSNNTNPMNIATIEYCPYDPYNLMVVSLTDNLDVKTTYSYDYNGLTTTINDYTSDGSLIRSVKETHNSDLAIVKVEDLLRETENKQIQEISYPEEETTTSGDSSQTQTTVVDPDRPSSTTDDYGNITSYDYDDRGNLIKTTYPDGSYESYQYNDNNNLITYTDRNGLVTQNTYSNEGFLLNVVIGGIQTNTYTYYTNEEEPIYGLVKSETDIYGNVTSYIYDDKGNVKTTTQVINGSNYITENTYDDLGRLIKTVDQNGITTEYIYNEFGNLLITKVYDVNEDNIQITRCVYDTLGRVVQEIGPNEYDPLDDNLDTGIYPDTTAGTRTVYNTDGQVIKEIDNLGNTTTYVYDNDGNVIKEIQPNGSYTLYEYDKDKRKTKESFYDHTAETTTVLEEISYSETVNQVTTKQYIRNNVYNTTVEVYNWEGMLLTQKINDNLIKTNTYDDGLLVREEDCCGGWTEYYYDSWGRKIKKTSAFDATGNSITKYVYDNYGNLVEERVKNNGSDQQESYSKTGYEYDLQGNCVKTIYYDKNKPVQYIQNYYDWDGKILREYKRLSSPITINGLDNVVNNSGQDYAVIKYEYDSMNRLIKKTDALGRMETYEYDLENQETKRIDKKGVTHEITYDKNGNEIRQKSGDIVKEYTYDSMGNVLSESEGDITTTYTYDGKGNCLTETTGNIVKTFTYDYSGNQTGTVIRVNNTTVQSVLNVYDSMGRLLWVYENGTRVAIYTYDLLDRVIKTVYSNGTIEENTYNLAGLVTSTINKKGSEVLSQYIYTYYFDGKERTKTDINGTSYYVYDGLGQLSKEVEYDTSSNNTTTQNAIKVGLDIPIYVDINEANQVKYYKFTPAISGEYYIESKYNSNDPVMSLYTPSGYMINQSDNQSSDNLNFGYTMTLTAGTEYTIAVEEKTGTGDCVFIISQKNNDNTEINKAKMIDTEYVINVKLDNTYETRYYTFIPKATNTYTIRSIGNSGSAARCVLYDSQGNDLANILATGGSKDFNFQHNLVGGYIYTIGVSVYAGSSEFAVEIVDTNSQRIVTEYSYDTNGNRIKLKSFDNGSISETNYTYDKNDRLLTQQVNSQTAISYTYDDNGNLLSDSSGIEQTFDELNRMIAYKSSNNITTNYTYYPDDMRKSKKTGNSNTITHVWVDGNITVDLSENSAISSYVFGDKLIKGGYGWYLYNAHGDVVSLVNASGDVTKNYDYDPFGIQISENEATDLNPYRYCGEYYDLESGYTYLEARYYNPELGRFISEDPAFDGNNWYVYCGNDPINMVDPTGMWSGKVHEEITGEAYKSVKYFWKNLKINLNEIKKGSTYPDKKYSGLSANITGNGKWHGHKEMFSVILNQQLQVTSSCIIKNYNQASFEIGKALHTIQDYYAHNVVLDGKVTNSRKVANGVFKIKNNKLLVTKKSKYFSEGFLKSCKKKYKIKSEKTSVHSLTADNPYAYFDDSKDKWVLGNKKSKRYKDAIDASKDYLELFFKSNQFY